MTAKNPPTVDGVRVATAELLAGLSALAATLAQRLRTEQALDPRAVAALLVEGERQVARLGKLETKLSGS